MSEAALDRLAAAQTAHLAALDAGDIAAIETSTEALRAAVAHIRGIAGWHARSDLRERLVEARKRADAARARVNWLADAGARRLDRLALLRGSPRPQAYGRSGRLG